MQAEGKLARRGAEEVPQRVGGVRHHRQAGGRRRAVDRCGPNVARNSVINAAELASYDQVKSSLLAAGMEDGVLTHLAVGPRRGLRRVLRGPPRGRREEPGDGDSAGKYAEVRRLRRADAQERRAGAFYKGFIPNFGRLGSWNVVMFLTLEQVKKAMRERRREEAKRRRRPRAFAMFEISPVTSALDRGSRTDRGTPARRPSARRARRPKHRRIRRRPHRSPRSVLGAARLETAPTSSSIPPFLKRRAATTCVRRARRATRRRLRQL